MQKLVTLSHQYSVFWMTLLEKTSRDIGISMVSCGNACRGGGFWSSAGSSRMQLAGDGDLDVS